MCVGCHNTHHFSQQTEEFQINYGGIDSGYSSNAAECSPDFSTSSGTHAYAVTAIHIPKQDDQSQKEGLSKISSRTKETIAVVHLIDVKNTKIKMFGIFKPETFRYRKVPLIFFVGF